MVSEERLRADALTLQTLVSLNSGHLSLVERSADFRRFVLRARLDAPVSTKDGYRIDREHTVLIEIPDGYLGRGPGGLFTKSRIKRQGEPVYHPNVWPSDGYFCFDDQFHPAKSLAEQTATAFDMMQCKAVNHDSPANWEADYYFLHNEERVRSQIRQVEIRRPRGLTRLMSRSMPRIA
jgi:ubiquitin-protein ligase